MIKEEYAQINHLKSPAFRTRCAAVLLYFHANFVKIFIYCVLYALLL